MYVRPKYQFWALEFRNNNKSTPFMPKLLDDTGFASFNDVFKCRIFIKEVLNFQRY